MSHIYNNNILPVSIDILVQKIHRCSCTLINIYVKIINSNSPTNMLKRIYRIIVLQTSRNYSLKKELQKICRKHEGFLPPPPSGPPAHQIKVCNIERLRTVRDIKTCDCPPKQPAMQYDRRNKRTIWLLVKLMIFCGAVRGTKDLGVWTTADETEKIYLRMYEAVNTLLGNTDNLTKNMKVCCIVYNNK